MTVRRAFTRAARFIDAACWWWLSQRLSLEADRMAEKVPG